MTETSPARTNPVVRFTARHRTLLGTVGGIGATGLAVLWTVVVPDKAGQTTGLQEAAIRWGHPLCWALLAVTSALWAVRAPARVVAATARVALGAYAAFLAALAL
jgi:hypothetical protein